MRRGINTGYEGMRNNPATVALVALGIGIVATIGVVGTFYRGEDTRSIVHRSPCLENPAGRPCQEAKRQSDQKRSVADTCIAFRKVGYLPCPVQGKPRERRPPPAPSRGGPN